MFFAFPLRSVSTAATWPSGSLTTSVATAFANFSTGELGPTRSTRDMCSSLGGSASGPENDRQKPLRGFPAVAADSAPCTRGGPTSVPPSPGGAMPTASSSSTLAVASVKLRRRPPEPLCSCETALRATDTPFFPAAKTSASPPLAASRRAISARTSSTEFRGSTATAERGAAVAKRREKRRGGERTNDRVASCHMLLGGCHYQIFCAGERCKMLAND